MTIEKAVDDIVSIPYDSDMVDREFKITAVLRELLDTKGKEIIVIDKDLQTWLKNGFLAMNDDRFSNYPKEAVAIKGLIKKAKNTAKNGDVKALLYDMIRVFLWKKQTGRTDYWRGCPSLPSALNKRWDQVLEATKQTRLDPDVDAFIGGEA